MKILVVDDEPPFADTVRHLLRPHDVVIETDPARTLDQVLRAHLESRPFDLVLCDIDMSDVCEALRRTQEPPLIFVMCEDANTKADTTLADGILSEPFTRSELEELIERIHLGRSRARTRRLAAIA